MKRLLAMLCIACLFCGLVGCSQTAEPEKFVEDTTEKDLSNYGFINDYGYTEWMAIRLDECDWTNEEQPFVQSAHIINTTSCKVSIVRLEEDTLRVYGFSSKAYAGDVSVADEMVEFPCEIIDNTTLRISSSDTLADTSELTFRVNMYGNIPLLLRVSEEDPYNHGFEAFSGSNLIAYIPTACLDGENMIYTGSAYYCRYPIKTEMYY